MLTLLQPLLTLDQSAIFKIIASILNKTMAVSPIMEIILHQR